MITTLSDPGLHFYGEGLLDPARTGRLVEQALKGCDDGELYLQYAVSESFSFDDGRLKSATYDSQKGFGLRGVAGEMTGFAHANELSDAAILRAAETVALVKSALHRHKPARWHQLCPQGRADAGHRRRRPRP
jgi:TldD protein